jgi:hypothetical protein
LGADPLFADDALHLAPNSPAIDAADWDASYAAEPLPNGGRANLGAFGNTSQATPSVQLATPEITTGGGSTLQTDITSLTLNGRTSSATLNIRVNGSNSGVSYAPGSTHWSFVTTLSSAMTQFSVRAHAASGQSSAPATIQVTYLGILPDQGLGLVDAALPPDASAAGADLGSDANQIAVDTTSNAPDTSITDQKTHSPDLPPGAYDGGPGPAPDTSRSWPAPEPADVDAPTIPARRIGCAMAPEAAVPFLFWPLVLVVAGACLLCAKSRHRQAFGPGAASKR